MPTYDRCVESDPKHESELARLRGLGMWMRDVGAVELSLGDVYIKLAPKPREMPKPTSAAERDEQKVLDDEERASSKLSDEEREWDRKWRRITRSSGSPIPPFPGKRSE